MFFINLIDVQEKKRRLYDISRQSSLSHVHSKQILKSLRFYKLIESDYDIHSNKYFVRYTELGIELRDEILRLSELLKKVGVW